MSSPPRITSLPLVDAVQSFMHGSGQTTHRMNAEQACLYTGLQLEELAEQIEAIAEGCLTPSYRAALVNLSNHMQQVGREFKAGLHRGDILRCDHAKLLDGQFDTAWTAIGAVMSTSTAPHLAIAHGAYTNLMKLHDGKCIKDANGKIQKPPGWQPPDFEPFTDRRSRS